MNALFNRKYLLVISLLFLFKLVIHWIGNANYGFHRDELLHLSVSEHMAWGYMEFPPFIAWLGRVSDWLFSYSLEGTRALSTMAGLAILVLSVLMSGLLNGDAYSKVLTAICVVAFLPFFRNHTLFQPVAFDQLFWCWGFYLVLAFLKNSKPRFLLFTGIILGVGLLNKYTMLIWAFGIFCGFILHEKGKVFRNKWLYVSGVIALVIFLPNLIWQIQHDFPLITHLQKLKETQLDRHGIWDYGIDQLKMPFTFFVSILGVIYLLRSNNYKAIGISAIIIFMLMWVLQAKSYYVFSLYSVLFSAGSVSISKWLMARRFYWKIVVALIILLPSIPFIPHLTPILPIDKYISYGNIPMENKRYQLTGDYADMFGWEEQVSLIDSIYHSFSPDEQRHCVIWAENYGEAGAIQILGKEYDLPAPISRHGSFWQWGYGDPHAKVWISLGNEEPVVNRVFGDVVLVKIINHPFAIAEENGIPVFICRNPKIDIPDWWAGYKPYIFD